MKKLLDKTLAMLLVLVMVVSLVPETAFAAEATATTAGDFNALQLALTNNNSNEVTLTADIAVTGQLTVNHSVTIKGEGKTLNREGDTNFTGTMFAINGSGVTLTLDNVKIDAGGGQWNFKAEPALENAVEKSWQQQAVAVTDIIEGTPTIISTDNLITLNGGANLVLNDGTQITGFYAQGSTIIRVSGSDSTVTFNKCLINHNYRNGGSNLLSAPGTNTRYNFKSGAKITDNYTSGNGGLIYVNGGSQVYVNEGAEFSGNVANGSNGSIFMTYASTTVDPNTGKYKDGGTFQASKVFMTGGSIKNNTALWTDGSSWGSMIYIHSSGEFEMTGGEIVNNTGANVGAISERAQNDARKMVLSGGTIKDNKGSPTSGCGDMYFTTEADIGPDMTVEGTVTVDAHGHLTNNGTIKGNVIVYSSNDGRGYTEFHNYGTVEGTVTIQNGANVTNPGKITGNVVISNELRSPYDETYGAFGNGYFVNSGTITGDMDLCYDSTVANSGTVGGSVTVQSNAKLLLDGGGTVNQNVTVYPGGEVRTNDPSRQGAINGKLTFEYGGNPDTEEAPNEDHQRMKDILEESNILANNVEYKHHAHTAKAGTENTVTGDCTTPAGTTYVCNTCGAAYYEGYESKEPPVAGTHKWTNETEGSKEATAEEFGYTKRSCSVCQAVEYDILPATGHKVVPLIESNGSSTITCKEGHTLNIAYDGTHTGTGHTWDDFILVEGQCNKEGNGAPDKMLFLCTTPGCHASCTISFKEQTHDYEFAPIDREEGQKIDNCASGIASNKQEDRGYQMAVVCKHCGKIVEGTTVDMTGANAAPAYEHVWYIDRTVLPNKSICTDDVYYTYKCAICKETKTDIIEPATAHEWEFDAETGLYICYARVGSDKHLCRQVQSGFNVSYQPRGGDTSAEKAPGFLEAERKSHLPNEEVELWFPTAEKPWVKESAAGQSVFVGWSTYDFGAEPLTSAPAVPSGKTLYTATGSKVTIPDPGADVVVYAVWALDLNRNGKPDYDTEGEPRYTIAYDVNGGTGATINSLEGALVGAPYPLADGSALKYGENVFAGWTLDANSKNIVIPANGVTLTPIYETAEDSSTPVVKTKLTWTDDANTVEIVHSPYTVNASDGTDKTITLYAVYAKPDPTDASKPGFEANYYHVEYYANGGEAASSAYAVDENDRFYTCNDYHENLSTVTGNAFLSVNQANLMIKRDGAVLVGWSEHKQTELISDKGTLDSLNLMSNNMALTFNKKNIKVYALWAQDRNHNHVGDYLEYTYNFTYHANEYLSNRTSSGSLLPTLTEPLTVNGAVPAVNSGSILYGWNNGAPTGKADTYTFVMNDEYVEVNTNTKLTADGNGNHYVQIGWSGFCHQAATSMEEARNWLVYEAGNSNINDLNGVTYDGKFYRHIQDSRYTDLYVVWAVDNDQNGIADFDEKGDPSPTPTPTPTPTPPATDSGTHTSSSTTDPGTLTPEARPNTNGEVNTTIQAQAVSDGIRDAQKNKADSVVIAPQVEGKTDKVTVTVPKTSVGDVGKAGLELRVETPLGNVTLPADSTKELARKDGSRVTVSVEAKEDGTTGIEVRTGNEVVDQLSGGLNVELPAETGNVLVVVNPDGTETVVKKSLVDENTVKALLDGSCNVKVEDRSKDFDDVANGSWFEDAVDFASSHELFEGVTQTTFDPDGSMTRGMLATVLWRLEGEAETAATDAFQDIVSGSWFEEGVSWANAKGIVQGYGDGTFGPDDNITREQLATMLYRYARQLGMNTRTSGSLSSFPDEGSVSSYATEAMQWAVGNGLVNGMADGTLNPGGNATRAQVATIIQRLITLMVK